jgi:sterol desaturase/sphingolipid hydroxylase (fatty acid hydroxylase superfamily)
MSQEHLGRWVVAIFVVMLVAELVGGVYRRGRHRTKDSLYALTGVAFQTLITPPLIGIAAGLLLNRLFPDSAGRYAGVSFWAVFPLWFVAEEFAHYWLHRWAHEWRWLWKLHRTHHSAPDLNVTVIFRYNVFWTFLLPQSWFGAVAVHFGLYDVLAASALTTFIVNILTHTSYRWDLALRRLPGMTPVFNVLEKVVTLPDTHHAHHGMGRHAHLRGNYAVTIFLFDILLGTARIPRRRQEKFGVPGRFDWKEEMLWPLLRRPDPAPATTAAE